MARSFARTRLMAGTRRSSRERGKSDQIDAVSVARAALAVGIDKLPTAAVAGRELDLRLLVDHRERLVRTRVALNSTLQWHLHDLSPSSRCRVTHCSHTSGTRRSPGAWRVPSRRCASAVARDELRRPEADQCRGRSLTFSA